MKSCLSLLALLMLTGPAFAQDDIVFGGGTLDQAELNALLGGRGNNGARGFNGNILSDPASLLNQFRDLLKDKKAPLDKNQEKSLQKLLESESAATRKLLESQFGNRGNNDSQNRGHSL